MDATVIATIVSVLALAIAGYAIYKAQKAGTPITGELLTSTIQASTNTAQEIATIVKAGVFAAEQLKSTGKLDSNNAAFQYALKFSQRLLPDLDAATLTTFIESMVPLANQVYSALPSQPVDTTPPAPHSPELGRMG